MIAWGLQDDLVISIVCNARFRGMVDEKIPEEEIDGFTVGYTENYLRVFVKGCLPYGKVKVKIIEKYQDGALAEVL